MLDTVSSVLSGIPGGAVRETLSRLLRPIVSALSSQITASGNLAIGTATTTAKIANTVTYVANGIHGSLATQDLPVPTGLIINAGQSNVVVWYVDSAGNKTFRFGVPAATPALVKFPTPAEGTACLGYVMLSAGATFTGGVTALSAAIPVYVNTVGVFDPSIVN